MARRSTAKVENDSFGFHYAFNKVCLAVSVASLDYGFPVCAHIIKDVHVPLVSGGSWLFQWGTSPVVLDNWAISVIKPAIPTSAVCN
jgi:hypothetical protein